MSKKLRNQLLGAYVIVAVSYTTCRLAAGVAKRLK